MTTTLVDQVYDTIKVGQPTPQNIMQVTVDVMQIVQKITKEKNKGEVKKQVVLSVMQKLIDDVENEEKKSQLQGLLDTAIPVAIDTIIKVATGEIDLEKYFKDCSSCCM